MERETQTQWIRVSPHTDSIHQVLTLVFLLGLQSATCFNCCLCQRQDASLKKKGKNNYLFFSSSSFYIQTRKTLLLLVCALLWINRIYTHSTLRERERQVCAFGFCSNGRNVKSRFYFFVVVVSSWRRRKLNEQRTH